MFIFATRSFTFKVKIWQILRFEAIEEAFKKRPVEVNAPAERPSEFYGKFVFNRAKMYKYLPADIYKKLVDVMDNGSRLDRSIADPLQMQWHKGMKKWAEENGVNPLHPLVSTIDRRNTEKHDAFIEHDGKGGMY